MYGGEKMGDITLNQISAFLLLIITISSSIGTILFTLKKIIQKQLEPLNQSIKQLDINQCRNYLVDFLIDVQNGIEKEDYQIKRAYEVYDHYTNDLNGNSYIHDKWMKLIKEVR